MVLNDPQTRGQKCRGLLRQNLLLVLTFVGVGIGFLVGLLVQTPTDSTIMWIGMPGELYIRMLKLMIIPLVICSVITGTSRMDPRTNGRVSGVALSYILLTNLFGSLLATVLSLAIKPGEGIESTTDVAIFTSDVMETEDIFADLLRNIVPDNMLTACFQQAQTKYEYIAKTIPIFNGTNNVTTTVREITRKYVSSVNSTNILGLIIISAVFGVVAAGLKDVTDVFLSFFRAGTAIIMTTLRVLLWTTPIGVASLIAKTMASTHDIEETFRRIAYYFLTVTLGQVILMFVCMPILFYIVCRKNPYRFIVSIIPSIVIVFATGSTMIALPESFKSLEEKNKVDQRVSRLVAPLAATIGRSGSAVYISTSCLFIIQLMGGGVTPVHVILVILLTWTSTLAIPSMPSSSLVTVLILLTALSIPGEAAAMLFALEFFLDRFRSIVNLNTQLMGVSITHTLCRQSLSDDSVEEVVPTQKQLLNCDNLEVAVESEKLISSKQQNI